MQTRVPVLLVVAALLCAAGTAHAQTIVQVDPLAGGQAVAPAVPDEKSDEAAGKAAAIITYDDGEVDGLYGAVGKIHEFAMLFSNIGGPTVTLGGVQTCWRQTLGDARIHYEVVLWLPDGPGGAPGTEIASFAAVAQGVTATPAFYTAGFSYPLTVPSVYVGVRWNPVVDTGFAFCIDTDGIGGAVHAGYNRLNETGAWTSLAAVVPSYNAVMIRAGVSTPGLVQESLYLPRFKVNASGDLDGLTTLIAVRNLTSLPVNADVEYFTVDGVEERHEDVALAAYGTYTRNLRDLGAGLAAIGPYRVGYVRVTGPGNADGTPVLAGDFAQLDVGNYFAAGDRLVRSSEICNHASVRFMTFPLPGSGTRLAFFVRNPRGIGAGDPISLQVRTYDEAGVLHGALGLKSQVHTFEYVASDFTSEPFGELRFDFTNAGGGVVYAESTVEGRFSTGVTSQCDGP